MTATAAAIYMEPSIQDIIVNLTKNNALREENLLPTLITMFPDVNERIRESVDD